MERRTLLKTAAASIATGATAFAFANSATAEEPGINFTATNPPTRQFDDGEVTSVAAYIEGGSITWDGLEYDAQSIDVELAAANPNSSGYTTLATKNLDLPGSHAKQGSRTFNLGPVDLTSDASPYTDADFSQDTDGEVKNTTVELRLTATINTSNENYSPNNSETDQFTVGVDNQPDSVTGDVESVSPASYSGNVINQSGEVVDTVWLNVYYGVDNIKVEMDLSNYVPLISSGAPLNGAIGIDADNSGTFDVQLGWLPGLNEPEFAYKENTGSGWGSWSGLDTVGAVETNEENGVVSFTIPRSYAETEHGISVGDTVRTGFLASAGGEEESAVVSDDGQNFWSSAASYTSSEHAIITQVE